jgi:hypothetical protein
MLADYEAMHELAATSARIKVAHAAIAAADPARQAETDRGQRGHQGGGTGRTPTANATSRAKDGALPRLQSANKLRRDRKDAHAFRDTLFGFRIHRQILLALTPFPHSPLSRI